MSSVVSEHVDLSSMPFGFRSGVKKTPQKNMKPCLGFVILGSKLFPVVLVMSIPASYKSGAQVAANKTVKCDSVYKPKI